jgi:hypothetical protein
MIKNFFDDLTSPENDKVSDKTMSKNIIACVVGVLICVVSLTAATWAWFGDTISSPVNSVQTGSYSIDVSVTRTSDSVLLSPIEEGGASYALPSGDYLVTLKAGGNVSTGYCIVDLSTNLGQKKVYSSQIFTEASSKSPTSISFSLRLSGDTVVDFDPCWGTHVVEDGVVYLSEGGSYTFDPSSLALVLSPLPDEAVQP